MSENQKKTILITDDSAMNRAILLEMLEDEFEILEAENGRQAVALLQEKGSGIDLMLLDAVMPEMDGFQVLSVMGENNWLENIPVIMISAETDISYTERAYELGATDFINRPFVPGVVHRRIRNTIALYAKQKKLMDILAEQVYEKIKNTDLMVAILSHIVEFRNGESGMHVLRVNALTELFLKKIMQKTNAYPLTKNDIAAARMASSLHDIGKIATPEEILNKPGRLTAEEFAIMKGHSMAGATMMEQLPFYHDEKLVDYARKICRWHHERWDGRGYPDGLVGDEIPIIAQAVSIADVYDALTSKRCYKDAYSHEKAIEMIINGECGQFNPLLIECLKELGPTLQQELDTNALTGASQRVAEAVVDELDAYDVLSAYSENTFVPNKTDNPSESRENKEEA